MNPPALLPDPVELAVGRPAPDGRKPQDVVEGKLHPVSAVEPEAELVKVGLQVLLADPVVRSVQPRLEVAENSVDVRDLSAVLVARR